MNNNEKYIVSNKGFTGEFKDGQSVIGGKPEKNTFVQSNYKNDIKVAKLHQNLTTKFRQDGVYNTTKRMSINKANQYDKIGNSSDKPWLATEVHSNKQDKNAIWIRKESKRNFVTLEDGHNKNGEHVISIGKKK